MAFDERVGVSVVTTSDNAGIDKTEASLGKLKATADATNHSLGKMSGAGSHGSSFDSFNKSLGKVGTTATSVGRSLSTYVTAPIALIGAESVKMAMNFQQSMELLHTNANVPQSAIASLSDSILKLAPQVGAGPEALAKAMYHVASATPGVFNAAKEMDILKISAEGAAIGQASLDDTTYSLTSALSSNIIGAKDASQMMGTLLAIVGSGDMTMQNLNDAIGTGFLGTAQAFGVSIQSIGSVLATLGDNGERGAAAANRLRMMMTLMASPSKAASKILGALGLTTSEVSATTGTMNEVFARTGLTTTKLADDLRQPNGINVAIEDLKSKLEASGMTASQTDAILSKAFGGGKSDAALLQLLSNIDKTNQKFGQINASATNFGNNWADQQATAKQKWNEAWGGIQSDLIKLGMKLLPDVIIAMQDLGKAVTNVTDWYDGLSKGQKQFVVDAAGVAVAAGPILLIFGTMAGSLSKIGDLIKMVGSPLTSILKSLGSLSGAGAAGDLAGMTAAGEAGGGLMAVLGPVALGIGAIGLAAGGAYLLIHHFNNANNALSDSINTKVMPEIQDYQNLAKNLGVTLTSTGSTVNILSLAQTHQADSVKLVNTATTQLQSAQTNYKTSQIDLTQKTNDYHDAQANAQKMLQQFGQNSPQYASAAQTVTDKYDSLAQALNSTAGNSLKVIIQQGYLKKAEDLLSGSTINLSGTQDYLNKMLDGGIGVIARFAPTALSQVGAIDTLQAHISGVVTSFNGLVANIQGQNPILNNSLQGLGSTIDRVQNQSITLNASLGADIGSASALQNSSYNLQGSNFNQTHNATGTSSSSGGWSMIGEQGPEMMYIPRGASIKTNSQSAGMSNGGDSTTSVSIGNVYLGTEGASKEFFRQLNQDTMNLGKGLTAVQGSH